MTDFFELRVYESQQLVWTGELARPAVLGRQSQGEPAPYYIRQEADLDRVVIARFDETTVPRKYLRLEPLDSATIRICNLSVQHNVRFSNGTELRPQAIREFSLPVAIVLATKTLRIQRVETPALQSLAEATRAPGLQTPDSYLVPLRQAAKTDINSEALIRWLQATSELLHSAASSSDFFDRAAMALVQLVGLDTGRLLMLEHGEWTTKAIQQAAHADKESNPPSRQILAQVRLKKRTLWQAQDPANQAGPSLAGMQAVVAAPILSKQGEVIGALYGDLKQRDVATPALTSLEAMLVEVLASGVAAGLTRVEQEQAALAARVQFEQFFTPELARSLETQPDLLAGRDTEVTLLFCDIHGFSRVSERLGPAGTVAWISEIMEELSGCVLAEEGVLVDYIGDELIAMWGAPAEQPDHACRACRAGVAMLERLGGLNARWEQVLGEPLRLGIGINTGIARVGNTGSRRKFKYGPLGNTVNLASRVQGATKYFKVKLIVTGATLNRLDNDFCYRRLGRIKVVNIAEPVEIYELMPPSEVGRPGLKKVYEEALAAFERKEFAQAARAVGNYLADHPGDGPSLILLARAANALADPPEIFDPVWELHGK